MQPTQEEEKEQHQYDDLNRDKAAMKVNRSIGFLVTTVQRYWGDFSALDLAILHPYDKYVEVRGDVREDLNSRLQDVKVRTGVMRLLRGLAILIDNPTCPSGWEDLQNALRSADESYSQTECPAGRIMCFEIMVACMLVLTNEDAAIKSIYTLMELLLHQDDIQTAIESLCECLNDEKEVLPREHKALLDLFFSRICGALAACERIQCFARYKDNFRRLFVSRVDGENDIYTLLTHNKWETIRVLKMGNPEMVAVTAAPAVAMWMVEFVGPAVGLGSICTVIKAGAGAVGKLGKVPPIKKLDSFSKPLSEFDDQPNLYDLRNQIMLLVQG